MSKYLFVLTLAFIFTIVLQAQDGPFSPAAGQPGSTAIHKDSSIIIAWSMEGFTELGYMDINEPDSGYASHGVDSDILGYSDNMVQSLGDGGTATYFIDPPMINGPGSDFAVFENSFSDDFLEFAHVEVSSDGTNFYRFPSICLIQNDTQVDGFGTSDPTQVHNLAGKYRAEYGTPFDLTELETIDALDINKIVAIRIIDVIGNISEPNTSMDSEGNIINDPYPTLFPSSGFDLDALGLIHVVTSIDHQDVQIANVYPNPSVDECFISVKGWSSFQLSVFDISGHMILEKNSLRNITSINTSGFKCGMYLCKMTNKNKVTWVKIFKQ